MPAKFNVVTLAIEYRSLILKEIIGSLKVHKKKLHDSQTDEEEQVFPDCVVREINKKGGESYWGCWRGRERGHGCGCGQGR